MYKIIYDFIVYKYDVENSMLSFSLISTSYVFLNDNYL